VVSVLVLYSQCKVTDDLHLAICQWMKKVRGPLMDSSYWQEWKARDWFYTGKMPFLTPNGNT